MVRWLIYDRAKGKQPTVLGVEFGEKLLHKVKPTNKMEKINAMESHQGEEEWGVVGGCQGQGFNDVGEKDTSGTEVVGGLHFMG